MGNTLCGKREEKMSLLNKIIFKNMEIHSKFNENEVNKLYNKFSLCVNDNLKENNKLLNWNIDKILFDTFVFNIELSKILYEYLKDTNNSIDFISFLKSAQIILKYNNKQDNDKYISEWSPFNYNNFKDFDSIRKFIKIIMNIKNDKPINFNKKDFIFIFKNILSIFFKNYKFNNISKESVLHNTLLFKKKSTVIKSEIISFEILVIKLQKWLPFLETIIHKYFKYLFYNSKFDYFLTINNDETVLNEELLFLLMTSNLNFKKFNEIKLMYNSKEERLNFDMFSNRLLYSKSKNFIIIKYISLKNKNKINILGIYIDKNISESENLFDKNFYIFRLSPIFTKINLKNNVKQGFIYFINNPEELKKKLLGNVKDLRRGFGIWANKNDFKIWIDEEINTNSKINNNLENIYFEDKELINNNYHNKEILIENIEIWSLNNKDNLTFSTDFDCDSKLSFKF